MTVLGLINARGGSKGVPRKNLKPLLGKPLIAYAVEAGRASSRVTDLVVSTDDAEIAEVARAHGAETPFMRPAELATDSALQIDVVIHAINALRNMGREYDHVAILQATAPLRRSTDIDGALKLLMDSGADTVATFSPAPHHHPYYMYRIVDGCPESFLKVPDNLQRQEFPEAFVRNGAVYAAGTPWIEQHRTFYGGRLRAYLMPPERSINIDTLFDWQIAEILMRETLQAPTA